MNTDKNKPEYYSERIFYMLSLLKNYCDNCDDIYEIETIMPAVEHTCKLADKLYSYFINNETFE
jgi:hypothetical protein